jgi:hypothetical protein
MNIEKLLKGRSYIEVNEIEKDIIKNPEILPKIIDKIHPYYYQYESGVLGHVVESGNIKMLNWFVKFLQSSEKKVHWGSDFYKRAFASKSLKMLKHIETVSKIPLSEYKKAYEDAGRYGSKKIINYLIESKIPQKSCAYKYAPRNGIDFLEYLYEQKITYDESALLELLNNNKTNIDALNWYHNKGFRCNDNEAYKFAVYSGNKQNVIWLAENKYVCQKNFCKWDLDEDYFEGDILLCLEWLTEHKMITKGLKKLQRFIEEYS